MKKHSKRPLILVSETIRQLDIKDITPCYRAIRLTIFEAA